MSYLLTRGTAEELKTVLATSDLEILAQGDSSEELARFLASEAGRQLGPVVLIWLGTARELPGIGEAQATGPA